MHIYFSGIGGTGIGPLALIAAEAGFQVSGSDKQDSNYIHYLQKKGITNIHIGQSYQQIEAVHAANPIDWFVYTSALPMEHPDAPELQFCRDKTITATKRDEFLSQFLADTHQKLIAIAGTHGKTTTTAMAIWLCKQLGLPISYTVGAKMSYGDMGEFTPKSEYFVYECDEFDRNFLAFTPHISLITGIDWDHPDVYPTRDDYYAAFRQFLRQSQQHILWDQDAARLHVSPAEHTMILHSNDPSIGTDVHLAGVVNRQNAWLVAQAIHQLTRRPLPELLNHLNRFPGVSRRFEQIAPHIYSDYAHTPPKIRGALQLVHEVAGDNVVVVYEGLHNTRQHFIKEELAHLFDGVKKLYIVPSYLAREDPSLPLLSPSDLAALLSRGQQADTIPAALDDTLKAALKQHVQAGDTVLCITAGGGGSLDEWLRRTFQTT